MCDAAKTVMNKKFTPLKIILEKKKSLPKISYKQLGGKKKKCEKQKEEITKVIAKISEQIRDSRDNQQR